MSFFGNTWWIGLIAGVVMAAVAMLLRAAGFSKLDMLGYEGAFFTGKRTGVATIILGSLMHGVVSVVVAYIYIFALRLLGLPVSWYYGLLLGILHWIIAGLVIPLMDDANPGVRGGFVLPVGVFAYKYGLATMASFALAHLAYGLTLGLLYSKFGG